MVTVRIVLINVTKTHCFCLQRSAYVVATLSTATVTYPTNASKQDYNYLGLLMIRCLEIGQK